MTPTVLVFRTPFSIAILQNSIAGKNAEDLAIEEAESHTAWMVSSRRVDSKDVEEEVEDEEDEEEEEDEDEEDEEEDELEGEEENELEGEG